MGLFLEPQYPLERLTRDEAIARLVALRFENPHLGKEAINFIFQRIDYLKKFDNDRMFSSRMVDLSNIHFDHWEVDY